MKKTFLSVSGPSKAELITLRLMILIGVFSMFYLLFCLFNRAQIGYAPYYWILMLAISFNCFRILHEWYHYFSISVPVVPPPDSTFSVDIFTTFCKGEPYEMVVATLEAIQQISYPHTTYLCDEANDPYLAEVCKRLNIRHVTRTVHKDAKAGNINNALQYASGDLCVILDPDHIPQPDFLDPIIPHFNDPNIGFVQIVQAYHNLGETFIAKGAAQQTFQFYGPIMMTMNSYGSVQAIGANCTFRRAALNSIGGHAAGLAEDMHTALQLHAAGWSSVYVPAVLARGLVPASLSAYYAQQLKWSRGTFEIFFTSFIRLFTRLSWRQKIHYGTVPLYYLSGFVVLINFIIPILSLCTGLIPFRVDMIDFLLLGMPALVSTVLIRHYVQRWVMEEKERGFHVIGGLLQIGTWWVYIMGFVYTIIRKKVPYIPTPKDNSSPDPWSLNIPNILVILVSVFAIIYGLTYDWNPYSIVMASIAGVNCAILTTVILISRANDDVKLRDRYAWVKKGLIIPLMLKRKFWLFRHAIIYRGLRKLGLAFLSLSVFTAWYLLKVDARPPSGAAKKNTEQKDVFYTGIFQPGSTEGLADMDEVRRYESRFDTRFNIISLYIPWGDAPQCFLPDSLIAKIYANGSLPMVTWEPWTSLFEQSAAAPELKKEQKIFKHLLAGSFDHYLETFAAQIKKLNRPVFIRFAHEPDNPAYPWSPTGQNTPEEYKQGWKYVYGFFLHKGVNNVVWVWNPWKAPQVSAYFPGRQYVDWLGVTSLDYGEILDAGTSFSFADLYKPFHDLPVFRSGIPVMIGEMGTLARQKLQTDWFSAAFRTIDRRFPEIHAAVFFNSSHDKNVPLNDTHSKLDWKWQFPDSIVKRFKMHPHLDSSRFVPAWGTIISDTARSVSYPSLKLPDGIRGMNYHTGKNWYRNFHDLTRRRVMSDVEAMKEIGVTTIKRYGPGIYDRNVLKVAGLTGMNVVYSFWMPSVNDIRQEEEKLSDAEEQILKTVRSLKDQKSIIAWSIGNTVQYLSGERRQPSSIYQQEYFMIWLNKMVDEIKSIDSSRPVTIDIALSPHLEATISMLRSRIRNTDAFGLVIDKDTTGIAQLATVNAPIFISEISPEQFMLLKNTRSFPVFIKEFQDQQTRDFITFNGVIDHWGRRKPGYELVRSVWTKKAVSVSLPSVKILRPAKTVFGNRKLTYCVLVDTGDGWRFPGDKDRRLRFEWYLIKTGENGEDIYLKQLGVGSMIDVNAPEEPHRFKIYVEVIDGAHAAGAQSILNLPLINGE